MFFSLDEFESLKNILSHFFFAMVMWSAVPVALLCVSMLDEDEAEQRPQRGRSPVEHRGTFVHPSICPSVRPPQRPEPDPGRPKPGPGRP